MSKTQNQAKNHNELKQGQIQAKGINLEPAETNYRQDHEDTTSILSFTEDESIELRISSWLENKGIFRSSPKEKQESYFAQKKSSTRRKWSMKMNLNSASPPNNLSDYSSLDSTKELKLSVGGSSLLKRRQTKLAGKSSKQDSAQKRKRSFKGFNLATPGAAGSKTIKAKNSPMIGKIKIGSFNFRRLAGQTQV